MLRAAMFVRQVAIMFVESYNNSLLARSNESINIMITLRSDIQLSWYGLSAYYILPGCFKPYCIDSHQMLIQQHLNGLLNC